MEIPSLALRVAWVRPLMLAVKRLAMAWPAASSLALLMRRPDDRRSMAVPSADWDFCRLPWATKESALVLMTDILKCSCREMAEACYCRLTRKALAGGILALHCCVGQALYFLYMLV